MTKIEIVSLVSYIKFSLHTMSGIVAEFAIGFIKLSLSCKCLTLGATILFTGFINALQYSYILGRVDGQNLYNSFFCIAS